MRPTGLFEKIFHRPGPVQIQRSFDTLTAYKPVFRTWRGGLYEQELVRAAINARATHISKLDVHVSGAAKPHLQTMLRQGPNEWQTWGQFLYRVSTILDVNNTAFVVPVLDQYGDVTGFYPILPERAKLIDVGGNPYLRYEFRTGQTAAMELERVGIMTKHQYEDDFAGTNNENSLRPTLQLIDIVNQGIQEGVRSSATYRFFAQLGNFSKDTDLAKERKRFTAENLKADEDNGGMLLFPSTYNNITQIKASAYTVDPQQMQQIRENVYSYFGVNANILQNSAMGDELDAFFNGAIEPFSIQLSDVLTRMVFTGRERAAGARIAVTANRLQYMPVSQKIAMATQLGDRGMIMIDEIRALFNMEPLPDGEGQKAPIRGEYYFNGEDNEDGTTGTRVPDDAPAADKDGSGADRS